MKMNAHGTTIRVVVDEQTAFPLIEIDRLKFAVSWLPMTLVQLELFLSDINDAHYNADWYMKKILKNKPRISPHSVMHGNIAGTLATNILLPEARRVADWFGNGVSYNYSLPTGRQWQEIRSLCKICPVQPLESLPDDVDPRARALIARLQDVIMPPAETLADQMLLGSGDIDEYVYLDDGRQTCEFVNEKRGTITPFKGSHASEGFRRKDLTFRLIRRVK